MQEITQWFEYQNMEITGGHRRGCLIILDFQGCTPKAICFLLDNTLALSEYLLGLTSMQLPEDATSTVCSKVHGLIGYHSQIAGFSSHLSCISLAGARVGRGWSYLISHSVLTSALLQLPLFPHWFIQLSLHKPILVTYSL